MVSDMVEQPTPDEYQTLMNAALAAYDAKIVSVEVSSDDPTTFLLTLKLPEPLRQIRLVAEP